MAEGDEDDECASEEECEINWDLMPGGDNDGDDDEIDDNELEEQQPSNSPDANQTEDNTEDDNDGEGGSTGSSSHFQSNESFRHQSTVVSNNHQEDSTPATLDDDVQVVVEYNDFEQDVDFSTLPTPTPSLQTTTTTPSPSSSGFPNDKNTNEQMTTTTKKKQATVVPDDDGDNDNQPLMNWKHRMVSLEMTWQMTESVQECQIEYDDDNALSANAGTASGDAATPVCGSHECPQCQGRGWTICRLCQGTSIQVWQRPPSTTSTSTLGLSPITNNKDNNDGNVAIIVNNRGESSRSSCPICKPVGTGTEVCRVCQGSGFVADWTHGAVTTTTTTTAVSNTTHFDRW